MIYIEYVYESGKIQNGFINYVDSNCEFYHTNSRGVWGCTHQPGTTYAIKKGLHWNQWIEQCWIDVSKFKVEDLDTYYRRPIIKSTILSEIRKLKLERICQ